MPGVMPDPAEQLHQLGECRSIPLYINGFQGEILLNQVWLIMNIY